MTSLEWGAWGLWWQLNPMRMPSELWSYSDPISHWPICRQKQNMYHASTASWECNGFLSWPFKWTTHKGRNKYWYHGTWWRFISGRCVVLLVDDCWIILLAHAPRLVCWRYFYERICIHKIYRLSDPTTWVNKSDHACVQIINWICVWWWNMYFNMNELKVASGLVYIHK